MTCNCIDYPVSWTFWRAHCIEAHGYDPGSDRPLEEEPKPPQVIEHIHRHSDMGKNEFDLLRRTVQKVEYLEKRLNERKPFNQGKYTIRS